MEISTEIVLASATILINMGGARFMINQIAKDLERTQNDMKDLSKAMVTLAQFEAHQISQREKCILIHTPLLQRFDQLEEKLDKILGVLIDPAQHR